MSTVGVFEYDGQQLCGLASYPTAGLKTKMIKKGKWYYEVLVESNIQLQVGWAESEVSLKK